MMEESSIISEKSGRIKRTAKLGLILGLLLSVGGFIAYFIVFQLLDAMVGNAAARATTPLFCVLMLIGVLLAIPFAILYAVIGKCEIFVTSTRIYGRAAFGKRVELPMTVVSDVSTGLLDSVVVTTASGAFYFFGMDRKDVLCGQIRQLLAAHRQSPFAQGPAAGQRSARGDEWEAIMGAVRGAVCAQLKSPASARFPADTIWIADNGANGYHVEGYVDSQNSYGAMIRNDFAADVTMQNGTPVVVFCSVAAKANTARIKAFGAAYLVIMAFVVVMGLLLFLIISLLVGLL